MKENELRRAMRAGMHEPPEGFDARSEMMLAKLMTGEEPKMKKISFLSVMVAAMLLLGTMTALAAGVEDINAILYRIWPEAARALRPVTIADEADGIRMELQRATLNDQHLLLVWSLTDPEGRIDETTDCYGTVLFGDGDGIANARLLSWNPEKKQAVFGCYLAYRHLPASMREALIGEYPAMEKEMDLIVNGYANSRKKTVNLGRPTAEEAAVMPVPDPLLSGGTQGGSVLAPSGWEEMKLTDGVTLGGVGWVDGKLHVQLHALAEAFVEEAEGDVITWTEGIHSRIFLLGKDGKEIDMCNGDAYGRPDLTWSDGNDGERKELIFDIGPAEMDEFDIVGEFADVRETLRNHGGYEWRVTFPTEIIRAEK